MKTARGGGVNDDDDSDRSPFAIFSSRKKEPFLLLLPS